jgi:hypothetical protein
MENYEILINRYRIDYKSNENIYNKANTLQFV